MSSAMMSFLIATGVASAISYALITRAQARSRGKARVGGGRDPDDNACAGTTDGWMLGNWFSGDRGPSDGSESPIDGGGCVGGDGDSSGSGSDCGGGGDGGAGGD